MIAVISMYNKRKEGTEASCCMNTTRYDIVPEIEAIDNMLERLDAKNDSNN